EELSESAWLPAIPSFTPASPYVRDVAQVVRPAEAPPGKWDHVLPQFKAMTRAAVDAAPMIPGSAAVDAERYRAAATDVVINRIVPRLNLDLWAGEEAKIVAAYRAALLPDTVTGALDDRLARLEIRALQARSLDAHIFNLTPRAQIASTWKLQSGKAKFIPA